MNNYDKKTFSFVTLLMMGMLGVGVVLAPFRSINSGMAFLLFMIVFSILWVFVVMLLSLLNPKMEASA